MKLSNSVIMPSINSPQFVIYLASQILKAYVQSILLSNKLRVFCASCAKFGMFSD